MVNVLMSLIIPIDMVIAIDNRKQERLFWLTQLTVTVMYMEKPYHRIYRSLGLSELISLALS